MTTFVRMAVAGLCLGACVPVPDRVTPSAVAARTLPVARAVHFAVSSGQIGDDVQGMALIRRSIATDPSILDGLGGLHVDAWHHGQDSLILVCDRADGQALVEDAGCTHAVDAERWRSPSACAFTLTTQALCR